MPARLKVLLAVALALGTARCGSEPEPEPPAAVPPAAVPPAGVPPAAVPTAGPAAGQERTPRAAASARLRAALDGGDLVAAQAALEELRRDHEGSGELPDGRRLPPEALIGALFDVAVAAARSAASGPAPDPARATLALDLGTALVGDLDEDEAPRTLAAARRWVTLESLTDLRTPLASHAGPRVVLAADDFDLGEPGVLRSLSRWAREGASAGLRVGLVPLLRGYVRQGTRRTHARDRDEERSALAARLRDTGIALEPEPPDALGASADLGLLGQDLALLVADREGRIVARVSGRAPDLVELEGVVQRVGSR